MCRNCFKQFSNFLTLFDISLIYGGEIIENPNTHIMYPSLVNSKISNGMIKVI